MGLEETVDLAGFHTKPSEIYNEGDLNVLSSISEGFPYTVLESMACERPVVATDVGGVREAIADCGIVVPPKNAVALGNGLAELLLDDARRRDLGTRGRERVLKLFRLDQCAQNYLDLYRRMVVGVARGSAGLRRIGAA
jgi:glycosyltransferase involved in cell wall biosynthesis